MAPRLMAVLAVAALLALLLAWPVREAPPAAVSAPVLPAAPAASPVPAEAAPAVASAPAAAAAAAAEAAPRRGIDEDLHDPDPVRRRGAARVVETCLAFLPPTGETPSPDALVQALPEAGRAEREAALRELFARCFGLLGRGRDGLAELQRSVRADPALREPGQRIQDALAAGELAQAEAEVARTFASGSPADVASLAGLAGRLAQLRAADDAGAAARAAAVDAALPLVACDLGLDCSAASLTALQLCAAQALCGGDVPARLARQARAEGLDAAAVEAARARLRTLVRGAAPVDAAALLGPP